MRPQINLLHFVQSDMASRSFSAPVSQYRTIPSFSRNAINSAIREPGPITARPDLIEDVERPKTRTASVKSRTNSSIRSAKSFIRPYFRSRRITKQEIKKPWIEERRSIWPTIIPCFGFACGLALMAVMVYLGVDSVPRHKYCLVMEDNFDGPTLNSSLWNVEVQLGGYGQVLSVSLEYDRLICKGLASLR